jgi:methylmalonyl-CoA mutase N-terminal domain/subunit
VTRSAYEHQKKIANGDVQIVGVNCFTGEHELEVQTTRLVPHPYDPDRRARAEENQITNLKEVKKNRDNLEVKRLLIELKKQATEEKINLVSHLIVCAKAYVTLQEVCDVLRDVFGEYDPPSIF